MTLECLDSILAHTPISHATICVLSHSVSWRDELASRCDRIMDVLDTPFVFARSVNRALEPIPEADAILLNNDCVVTPGWLEGLLAADPTGLSLVGARTDVGRCGCRDQWVGRSGVTETRYPLNFFCVLLSARARKIIGLLDERFTGYGGEDCDYSMRALRYGLRLLVAESYVKHRCAASFSPSQGHAKTMSEWQDRWPRVEIRGPFQGRVA